MRDREILSGSIVSVTLPQGRGPPGRDENKKGGIPTFYLRHNVIYKHTVATVLKLQQQLTANRVAVSICSHIEFSDALTRYSSKISVPCVHMCAQVLEPEGGGGGGDSGIGEPLNDYTPQQLLTITLQ